AVFPEFPGLAAQGQVLMPPGLDWHAPAPSHADREKSLRLAEAQVRLSAMLAEGMNKDKTTTRPAQPLNCQKRFHGLKREAELEKPQDDADRAEFDKRWTKLYEENQQLAKSLGYETVRTQAEKRPWPTFAKVHPALALARSGQPIDWI